MLGSRLWDQILYVCACRCPYHYVKTLTTYFGQEPACQLSLVLTSLLIDRQGTTLYQILSGVSYITIMCGLKFLKQQQTSIGLHLFFFLLYRVHYILDKNMVTTSYSVVLLTY